MTDTRDPTDIDIEWFNPVISEKRYRDSGEFSESEIAVMVLIDSMVYKRPVEEIRATVAKRKAKGLPL